MARTRSGSVARRVTSSSKYAITRTAASAAASMADKHNSSP
ncbi:hypothetical protein [Amycolatopsis sp. FDAARGOS 1241]|nr:hypothetical protein [Amycolatopsis sp. FDAARGOS 1241]